MPIQINDEPMASAFAAASAAEDVCGPDGRLLGHFLPIAHNNAASREFDRTPEELDQLLNDPNARWCTPEEVMARLREIDRCIP